MEAWTDSRSLDAVLRTDDLGRANDSTITPSIISFYENDVPAFVASELERLYSNLFSTLAQFAFRNSKTICTYVARTHKQIISLLLFEQKGPIVQVLNEGISLREDELERFTRAVFARYPSARIIHFHAVDIKIGRAPLPFQKHPALEDIVLSLPLTPEAYLAGLGKSTRSYLNRYLNKLRREFPSFRHEVLVGQEIDEDLIRELIEMHKIRMADMEKVSVIDEKRLQEIFVLSKKFGFVVVMRIDGRVCAGTINYRVGDNYFLETVAHDSSYNEYRIGTLCSYLTVCECIARSGKEYHFLWGDYDYKFRLGGVRCQLSDLYLYRSRLHMVFNSDFSISTAIKRDLLLMKKKLQFEASRQDTLRSRIAGKTLHLLRKGKQKLMSCD